MFAKISKALLVAMLSLTLGFHWTLLQSVAWVGMIVEYSGQSSLPEAMAKTFDGQHPCPICKLVRGGKNSDTKAELRQSVQKYDLFSDDSAAFYFPALPQPPFFHSPLPVSRLETPPLPPPRFSPTQV